MYDKSPEWEELDGEKQHEPDTWSVVATKKGKRENDMIQDYIRR